MTSSADAVLIGFIVTVSVVGLLATIGLVVFVCFKWKQFVKRRSAAREAHNHQQHRRNHNRRRRNRAQSIMLIQEPSQQCTVHISSPPAYDIHSALPPPYSLVDCSALHPRINELQVTDLHRVRSDSMNSVTRFHGLNSNQTNNGGLSRTNSGNVRNGRISSTQIMLSQQNSPLNSRRCQRRPSGRVREESSSRDIDANLNNNETIGIGNSNNYFSGHYSNHLITENGANSNPPERNN